MTLNEIASSIRNHVADALSGNITNQAFSIEQLQDEVDLKRSKLIHQYLHTGKLDTTQLMQNIEEQALVCRSLSPGCSIRIDEIEIPSIKVPAIATTFNKDAIAYLGLSNKQRSFKVYYDIDDIINHQYRHMTKHREFAWVDTATDENGEMTIYFFNMLPHDPLKFVSIRAIFEHPSQITGSANREYPAPGHLQNDIIKSLTEEYIRYYRQLNIAPVAIPNQQVDPLT